uniref:Uncharacterized protein n=1 Tax=Brassica campestris TaxID=3711 RepID=A0A3P5ZJV7_BRACM|nr:unnamed protein product [Brassica rapa]
MALDKREELEDSSSFETSTTTLTVSLACFLFTSGVTSVTSHLSSVFWDLASSPESLTFSPSGSRSLRVWLMIYALLSTTGSNPLASPLFCSALTFTSHAWT